MERDLLDYSKNYLGPFEQIQVQYRRKKVLEILDKYKPQSILEVGCGRDSIVNYIESEIYETFCIVEPISEFLKVAISQKSNKIHSFNDCIENVKELKNYHFDFIIISGLLHEVIEPLKILRGIFEISYSDTVVHVNVPNANSIHRLLAKEMGIIDSIYQFSDMQKIMQQHYTFDFESLKKLCSDAGFQCIEQGSLLIKPFTHLQMQKLLDLEVVDQKVIDGFYNLTNYFPENGSEIYLNLRKL
jgi:SAM-dependent methyltransferase